MKILVAILIAVSVLFAGCKESVVNSVEIPASAPTRNERKAEALADVKKTAKEMAGAPEKVDLTPLAGHRLGDLYAEYLGLPKGKFAPASTVISSDEVMSRLYHKKVNFERCNKKGTICKEASDTVLVQMPRLYKSYLANDKKKMSLKTFVGIADGKIASAKKSIDWTKVCKRYQRTKDLPLLSQKKCTVLKSVVAELAGKDMVAYGMTELLPSAEGKLNVAYMDVLLRSAGAEFLYHVPALGDELASLGFYQFTMYALRKDEDVTEGASIINSFVKNGGEKIPDSVVYLDGHEHHTAAFYFAVHNLSRLVFSLSEKGVKNLSTKHKDYQDEVVIYVAAAHHAPGTAQKKTAAWVNGGMKSSLIGAYGKHRIGKYALKTKGNLLAIYDKV